MKIAAPFAGAAIVATMCVASATASVPDSSGVIHACYTTSSGALRIIDTDDGGACYSYETAVSWNASTPSLKSFTGTGSYSGGVLVTCPDGGVPVSLWLNQNGSAYYQSPSSQTLAFPDNDTSQPPDGIGGSTTSFSSGTVYYTIICT
jgi:hypothetical protein